MKLLYTTNRKERDPSYGLKETLLILKDVGFREVVYLQTTPGDERFKDLSGTGITYGIQVEKTLSLQRILNAASKESVSLVIADFDRAIQKPSRSFLIRGLIRKTSVPVLVLNNIPAQGDGLFEHIIFPTDWSPASEKALAYLLGFSSIIKRLDIVNVINGKLTVRDIRELKEKLIRTRKTCLSEKIDAESHVYAGSIPEETIKASEDYKATLIILGISSKKPFYKRIFRKNLSFRIAMAAAVPVLIVP